ncbi:MAG: hypothetical protein K2L02_02080, partial [Clostridia bacterium]|nr:hypothetical protein [Clostridia bacterium]
MKCKNCGTELDPNNAEERLLTCEVCGTNMILTRDTTNPEAVELIEKGAKLLDLGEFDEAYDCYKLASRQCSSESEAYWGMALAEFRVQFKRDILRNCLQPVCRGTAAGKMQENLNYQKAMLFATPATRKEYRRLALEIDGAETTDEVPAFKPKATPAPAPTPTPAPTPAPAPAPAAKPAPAPAPAVNNDYVARPVPIDVLDEEPIEEAPVEEEPVFEAPVKNEEPEAKLPAEEEIEEVAEESEGEPAAEAEAEEEPAEEAKEEPAESEEELPFVENKGGVEEVPMDVPNNQPPMGQPPMNGFAPPMGSPMGQPPMNGFA